MKAKAYTGEALRRHLEYGRQSTNGCDRCWGQGCPDCTPDQEYVGRARHVKQLRDVTPPAWASDHDDLPWCPKCGRSEEEGCVPSCEYSDLADGGGMELAA